ncbi:MAG: hypothetical protein JRI23_31275 [Deltaproteobacteria bacterium]|jgi:hypothetical protein|nr:hypothetical protein [Deltaproteobacteria bacterium]MBW2536685.1 hypothetical protein [Deltaproteobacteria bacterium]
MTSKPEDKREDRSDDEPDEDEEQSPSSEDSKEPDEDDEDSDDVDDDEDDDEDSDDEDDDEDSDDEDDEPPEKAAKAKPSTGRTVGAKKIGKKPLAAARRRRKPEPKGSSTRNIILYIIVIGGIALAFAYLGQQDGGGGAPTPAPKWKTGDSVDVSITLVTTDVKDLACASEKEFDGLHCGFADKRKAHPKGADPRTDGNVLQPYTTTDRLQFMAAGMWVEPEIKAKLDKENWDNPSPRFTVNCKYKVAGKIDDAHVRWKPEHGWLADPASDWYVGKLSECKIRRSGRAVRRPPPKPPENKAEDKPAEDQKKE